MVEESFLPNDTGVTRRETFPPRNCFREVFFARARHEGMEMIRHEEPEQDVPAVSLVVIPDGGEEPFGDGRVTELVCAASLAAEGKKISGVARPVGRDVMEPAALREGHGGM